LKKIPEKAKKKESGFLTPLKREEAAEIIF